MPITTPVFAAVLALVLSNCGTSAPPQTRKEQDFILNGGNEKLGAVGGAIVGGVVGERSGRAVEGAVIGGSIGKNLGKSADQNALGQMQAEENSTSKGRENRSKPYEEPKLPAGKGPSAIEKWINPLGIQTPSFP